MAKGVHSVSKYPSKQIVVKVDNGNREVARADFKHSLETPD